MKKIISVMIAALFAATLSLSAQAAENPFGMSDLTPTDKTAMSSEPGGKCGGGDKKCGGEKKGSGDKKCGGEKKGSGDKKCGG